jgi:hypothetical protein
MFCVLGPALKYDVSYFGSQLLPQLHRCFSNHHVICVCCLIRGQSKQQGKVCRPQRPVKSVNNVLPRNSRSACQRPCTRYNKADDGRVPSVGAFTVAFLCCRMTFDARRKTAHSSTCCFCFVILLQVSFFFLFF